MMKLLGVVLLTAVLFAACSKDKDSGTLVLDAPALFLDDLGMSATIGFSAANVVSLSATDQPLGWEKPVIDLAARTITVTAPTVIDADHVESGSIVLTGYTPEGSVVGASLFVGVVPTGDLKSRPANSYLITSGNVRYLFDATAQGGITGKNATATIGVIWQTATNLIQYIDCKQGVGSFYIGQSDEKVKEGNALLGGYDASGNLLWSWHIWATDFDADAQALAYPGYTVMSRNLGALKSDNSTTENVLASFGLYYQWGRKDPFVGPHTYNAEKGSSAAMYNGAGSRVYLTTLAADTGTGTIDFATKNPLTFIGGVSDTEYDWLTPSIASVITEPLWSAQKTVYDPCPYGWRVADLATFDNLTIKEDLSKPFGDYYQKYGWTLVRDGVESLYMGAGRRIYTNATIQNAYFPDTRNEAMEGQPWVGYYWTTATGAVGRAKTLYFYFDKSDVAASAVRNDSEQYRANGMQVRCVKVQ